MGVLGRAFLQPTITRVYVLPFLNDPLFLLFTPLTYQQHTLLVLHTLHKIVLVSMICSTLLVATFVRYAMGDNCPCGWKVEETGDVYTHKIFEDFSNSPNIEHMLSDNNANSFLKDWMIYDF